MRGCAGVVLGLMCLLQAAHASGMRKTLFVFGGNDKKKDGPVKASSFSSVSSSSSSSASSSFSGSAVISSSSVSTSTSSSGDCEAWTKTTSTGGGRSTATGNVHGPCKSKAQSTSVSKGDEKAEATASAKSKPGKSATAISEAIGSGDGVDVIANAVAKAIKDGDGAAVARAVATSVSEKCPKGTKKKNCPSARATEAIVAAYASAENQAEGLAYAEAFAAGLTSKDEKVSSVFATAIARILKDDKCKKTKPLLAEAKAIAVKEKHERSFVDALDFDIKIAQCLFPKCADEILVCCSQKGEKCGCSGDDCSYELFKDTPSKIWDDKKAKTDSKCICPTS